MIGVVIATYGSRAEWEPYARRALRSVARLAIPLRGKLVSTTWFHSTDLATARNTGAQMVIDEGADWLIFLDADDELDERYALAMVNAVGTVGPDGVPCAIYRPNTIGVYDDEDGRTDPEPSMIPRTDMRRRNCCVIGTMVPAYLFQQVGGFAGYPHLEDWALFRAMLAAGAELVDVPDAIYRVHVRGDSRNAPSDEMNRTYRQILREVPL